MVPMLLGLKDYVTPVIREARIPYGEKRAVPTARPAALAMRFEASARTAS
jgi:hypothetical protein